MADEVLCNKCAALCCRYFALEIDKPTVRSQFEDLRWHLCHENVMIFIEDKRWFLGILNKCKHLLPDNRCGIYTRRPRLCRNYSMTNCDYHGGDYNFEKVFTSAEQLEQFAREYLRRKSRRVKARASAKPASGRAKRK